MRFCPNCGIPVGESPRYCAGCGTQVTPAPVGHPQADGPSGAAPAARSRRAAPGRRRRPAWSGHRMTITAMVVTLALVGTAGVAAWQVSQVGGQPSPAPGGVRAPRDRLMSGTGQPGSTQPAAHGSPAPVPRAARSTAPSAARPATAPAPVGNAVLAVGPLAAGGPEVRPVVALLTTYFESINDQNFAEYQSLFVPSIQRMMTHFGGGYAGTFDSGATLTHLVTTGPHGLAATVAFISHQNPASSPDGTSCDSWLITLFLKQQGNALHIRHPRPGFPQSVLSCH
jgi:hypothetical protein